MEAAAWSASTQQIWILMFESSFDIQQRIRASMLFSQCQVLEAHCELFAPILGDSVQYDILWHFGL